jgi:hypothetical protein
MHEKIRALLMAGLVLLAGSGCSASGLQGAGTQGATGAVDPVVRAKLSPGLLLEIEKTDRREERSRELEVLVRTEKAMGPAEQAAVETLGGRIGSVAGTIATVAIPADNVQQLAGLKFVISLELYRKQRLKGNPAKESDE